MSATCKWTIFQGEEARHRRAGGLSGQTQFRNAIEWLEPAK